MTGRILHRMAAVVLCGEVHTAPDLVVGPFDTLAEAEEWAKRQLGQPDRYAAPMTLTMPDQATRD